MYRFLSSTKRGQYSVWRGEVHLGHVTKIAHRHTDRGVTKTMVTGWLPSTSAGTDLASQPTRKDAAIALWAAHQASAY